MTTPREEATGDKPVAFESEEMARMIERDFWDLGEVIMSLGIITDFEGFADHGPIEEMMQQPVVQDTLDIYKNSLKNVPRDMLRDLTYHWLFETHDQSDYRPDAMEVVQFIHCAAFVLQSRWWMKTDSNA